MIRRYLHLLPIFCATLLAAALCGLITYWFLAFKAARTIPAPAGITAQSIPQLDLEPAKKLFGVSANSAAALAAQIQLIGVVAPDMPSAHGAAIVAVDGKAAEFVGVGKEIVPGVLLKEVRSKSIIVSRAGATEEIQLPDQALISGISAPTFLGSDNNGQPINPQNVRDVLNEEDPPPMPLSP